MVIRFDLVMWAQHLNVAQKLILVLLESLGDAKIFQNTSHTLGEN